jgi:hypothetical protein
MFSQPGLRAQQDLSTVPLTLVTWHQLPVQGILAGELTMPARPHTIELRYFATYA